MTITHTIPNELLRKRSLQCDVKTLATLNNDAKAIFNKFAIIAHSKILSNTINNDSVLKRFSSR